MAKTLTFVFFISLISILFSTKASVYLQKKTTISVSLLDTNTLKQNDKNPNGSSFTYVCDSSRYEKLNLNMTDFAFCDSSLTYEERATDLVNQMTLNEKVQQLGNFVYGVPRLGLPKYEWWSEALHGVSDYGPGVFFDELVPGATSFPTIILVAASFNESLWKSIGQAVSTEARAMHNLGRAGLTFWSPNVNVVRDPRWGRALETPGEDPYVVGRYAANYVRGLQDVEGTENYTDLNSRPLKVSSCCKHYAAYDVDKWNGIDRIYYDAKVTERDMIETFVRPFEMCVKEGDVSSIMCPYNSVNGIPACADPKLLNQTIRGEWDFHGYIVSDCDSVAAMVDRHKFLGDTNEDAVAQALKAGLDLDCGIYYTNFTQKSVEQGKVREEYIDRSLKYLYRVLMRLGFFDGAPKYEKLGKSDVCSKENIELAKEAAREGMVLLKNNATLPLNANEIKNIAVVGPHANATRAMIGNYAGVPCRYTSPIAGFSTYANVTYELGCDVNCKNESLIFPAVRAAAEADATVIVAGIDLTIEAEGLDRDDLLLPVYQKQLINQVANVAKGPVILVIMSAGGIDISFAKENENIKAILWVGYPGQEGGQAIADVVFGQYNPGGRLPITWYEGDYVDKLPMTSMQLRPNHELGYPGRTYKFYNGSTVYPFGYGLSYTNFTYNIKCTKQVHQIKLNRFQHCYDLRYEEVVNKPSCPSIRTDHLSCDGDIEFEVEVKNTGTRDGSEVIIVYSKPPKGIIDSYIKQVIDFKRVFVEAGKSEKVNFKLNACQSLKIVDYNAYCVLAAGNHTISVGDDLVSFPLQIDYEL